MSILRISRLRNGQMPNLRLGLRHMQGGPLLLYAILPKLRRRGDTGGSPGGGETMKTYEVNVQANKEFLVRARNRREARIKARRKFKRGPGRLYMDISECLDPL